MADAADSKSAEGNFMRVRLPPSAPREKTMADIPPQGKGSHKKREFFLWDKGAHKFRCVRLRRANKHKCSVRRNGRRSRLKICRGQLHVGSTPTTSTRGENGIFARFRFFLKKQKLRPDICFRLPRPNATLITLRVGRDLKQ